MKDRDEKCRDDRDEKGRDEKFRNEKYRDDRDEVKLESRCAFEFAVTSSRLLTSRPYNNKLAQVR